MTMTDEEFLETEEPEVEEVPAPPMGRPIMSGHCLFPQTDEPDRSHALCARMGAGITTKSTGLWHPCPDACHLGEEYECGNCGRPIHEAPYWLGNGEMTYVHVAGGRVTGEECLSIPRSA